MQFVAVGEGDGVVQAAVGVVGGGGDARGAGAQVVAGRDADLVDEIPGVKKRCVDDVEPAAQR